MVSVPGKVPPVCPDPQTRPGAATAGLERAAPGGWASRWSAPGGHPTSRPAGCSPRPRHGVKGREGAGMCRQGRPFPRKEPSARGRGVPPVPPPSSLQDALPSTGAAPGPAALGRTPATQASGRGGEVAAARGCHPGTPPRVPAPPRRCALTAPPSRARFSRETLVSRQPMTFLKTISSHCTEGGGVTGQTPATGSPGGRRSAPQAALRMSRLSAFLF